MEQITRRRFLRNSTRIASSATALAVGTGRIQEPLRAGRSSPNDQIHVGLVGCGNMGKHDLRAFLERNEIQCLAIADVDEEHLAEGIRLVQERKNRRPDGYSDFRRIMDRRDIDVVIVATPDHWHALPTIFACQSGKDVYVEKPLASSIHEGRAMVKAAQENNRVVQVGTQQRSAEHFQAAVDFVRSGQLGKIRMTRSWAYLDWKGGLGKPPEQQPPPTVDYNMWLGPAPERPFNPARFHLDFRWFWDYAGGLMTDWGAHMVDVVMWAMAEDPVGAMATGGKYGYPNDIMETPDTQQSIVEFPSFSMTWEHMLGCGVGPWQREHGIEFHGQNGILIVDRHDWEVRSETEKMDRPDRFYRMKPKPRRASSGNFHSTHVENFIDAVLSREKPRADIEVGHKSVIACHLGNIAVRLKRYVAWDPIKEQVVGDKEAQELVGKEYRAPWKLPV